MARRIVKTSGADEGDDTVSVRVREVGWRLAECQHVVSISGRVGVIEAALSSAKQVGGVIVWMLPGNDPQDANSRAHIPIATGLQDARNAIVARVSKILIVIAGEYGTLLAIDLVLNMGRRVIGLGNWHIAKAVQVVDIP